MPALQSGLSIEWRDNAYEIDGQIQAIAIG